VVPEPVRVRRIDPEDEAGLLAYVRIRNAATPDNTDSLAQVRWEEVTYPGEIVRFLAEADGATVGTACTGRIWMYERDFERYWLGIWVQAEDRGRGVGSSLYRAASDAARDAGKTGFQTELSEIHAAGHRFLAHRGFVKVDRDKMVRLVLAGLDPPVVTVPAGFQLATLAERPDLLPGIHVAAVDAFPDIPTGGQPVSVGTLEAFVARDVAQPGIPRDGFFVAVDEVTGEVVGYASLVFAAGSTTLAYHDMTAVRPAYRGRGLAGALKRATIAWAIGHGVEALETGNDERNAPMRAVNLSLGYQPIPDRIGLHGPLAPRR
jgi:mycothiol synthase